MIKKDLARERASIREYKEYKEAKDRLRKSKHDKTIYGDLRSAKLWDEKTVDHYNGYGCVIS
jgi:hypothetical protein